MSRNSRPESPYTVRIHKNGGYMYACTHTYRMDENGKRVYKVTHWGRLTPEFEFLPGKRYLSTPINEREKLIFPCNWNLKNIRRTLI